MLVHAVVSWCAAVAHNPVLHEGDYSRMTVELKLRGRSCHQQCTISVILGELTTKVRGRCYAFFSVSAFGEKGVLERCFNMQPSVPL